MTNTKNHYAMNPARYVLSALMLAALTACGGGGGGGDTSPAPTPPDNGTQTTETEVQTQSLECPAGQIGAITQERTNTRIRTDYTTGEPTYSAWTNGQWQTVSDTCTAQDDGTQENATYTGDLLSAFNEANRIREIVGLPLFKQNIKLDAAAQGHAEYLVLNRVIGHDQEAGKPGFTGVNSSDRAQAQGYRHSVGEGVTGMGTSSDINNLPARTVYRNEQYGGGHLGTVYHRQAFLDSRYTDFGIGYTYEKFDLNPGTEAEGKYFSHRFAVVFNFGTQFKIVEHAPIFWPYEGQSSVNTSFAAFAESPNPAPDIPHTVRMGYPVSVNLPYGSNWSEVKKFDMTCAGQPIQARTLTQSTDVSGGALGLNFVFLLPELPLPQNSTCEVSFNGVHSGGTVEKTWSFSTGTV